MPDSRPRPPTCLHQHITSSSHDRLASLLQDPHDCTGLTWIIHPEILHWIFTESLLSHTGRCVRVPGLGGGHRGELAPCPLISHKCSHHLHPTLMQSVGFGIPGHGPGSRGNNRGHYSLNKRSVFFQEFWKSKITVSSRLVSGEAASLV